MKEQDFHMHMQRVLQNLHQNARYARFFITVSRFMHDIDVKNAGFCSKILYLIIKTSRTSNFDAEKWFFRANASSFEDFREKVSDFCPYLYLQLVARRRFIWKS